MLDFAPDKDPLTPNVITDGQGLWPTMLGYRRAHPYVGNSIPWPVLSAGTWGSDTYAQSHYAYVSPVDSYTKWFVDLSNTAAKFLFRITDDGAGGYTATNVTPGGGLAAAWPNSGTLAVNRAWDFAAWGANCYATCDAVSAPNQGLYGWTGGATFTLIATSPQGRTVEVFKDFVIVGGITNTFGGGIVGTRDMIAWSDQGNPTVWTPASGVQANWNRLRDSVGNIVAIRRLGDQCVVYMTDSIYLMTYIGGAYTFKFEKVVDGIGCDDSSHTPSVVSTGNFHIFVHRNRVYLFDGTRPRPISQGRVERWMENFTPPLFADQNVPGISVAGTSPMHIAKDGVIQFGPDVLAYNYYADRWAPCWGAYYKTVAEGGDSGYEVLNPNALGGVSVAAALREWAPLSATHTYANYSATLWPVPYPEVVFGMGISGADQLSVYHRNPAVPTTATWAYSSRIVMGYTGSYEKYSSLQRVTVRFASTAEASPDTTIPLMEMTHEGNEIPEPNTTDGRTLTSTGITWDDKRRRFDLLISNRFHRPTIYFITPWGSSGIWGEIVDVKYTFSNGGKN